MYENRLIETAFRKSESFRWLCKVLKNNKGSKEFKNTQEVWSFVKEVVDEAERKAE